MRSTMNVSLPPALKQWVDKQVEAGEYGTASEFVRDLLRQARARQFQARMDPLLLEAIESGAKHEMNDADWTEIRTTARSQAKKIRRNKAK